MQKIKTSVIPAICWFIISTILLILPGSSFPKENWLDKIWFDKWVHIAMFAIMVVLWCRGWRSLKRNIPAEKFKKIFITIGIIWVAYGIAMEFVQRSLIPNRSFDIGDIIADTIGCTAGVIFSIRRYIKNRPL